MTDRDVRPPKVRLRPPFEALLGGPPASIELRTKGVGERYDARTQLAGIAIKTHGTSAAEALFRLGTMIDSAHRTAEDYAGGEAPDGPPAGGPFR